MAVVGTAGRGLIIYQLENQPQQFKTVDSPLKYQVKIYYSSVSQYNYKPTMQVMRKKKIISRTINKLSPYLNS